jgi:hypothetical protein
MSAGHASKRSAVELRAHALALADTLGYVLVEDPDPGPDALGYCDLARRRIVTQPIADLTSYFIALHECGHAATLPAGTRGPRARTAGELLLSEARATVWALDHAMIPPDRDTELSILDGWACHIEEQGGDLATGGVELVAAEHRLEYAAAWGRCSTGWTWHPGGVA